MAQKLICEACGSDDVSCDAAVRWNAKRQEWEITAVFNDSKGACTCNGCEVDEAELIFQDIPEQEALRPHRDKTVMELTDLVDAGAGDALLASIAHELTHRSTPKAKRLAARLAAQTSKETA